MREQLQTIFEKRNLVLPQNEDEALAIDSLNFMMLIYDTETAFGIKFGLHDFDNPLSFRELIALIKSKQVCS